MYFFSGDSSSEIALTCFVYVLLSFKSFKNFFLSSSPFSMCVTVLSAVPVLLVLLPVAPAFPYYDFGFPSTSLLIITSFLYF